MRLTPSLWAKAAASSRSTSELSKWFASRPISGRRPNVKHDSKRRDIINSKLCDQAVQLTCASLPPPSTCDIIDINPGAGLWSEALHDALKPRRHILVDGEKETYKEALGPLLNAKDSVYRHTTSIRKAFDLSEDLLSPEFKQAYESLDNNGAESETRRKPTSQIILTANLARRRTSAGGFNGDFSKLFFDQFYRAIAFDAGLVEFHKFGLVKLLAWVPDSEKASVVPRSVVARSRLARQIEASCHVREIVSSFPSDGVGRRLRPWYGAELESMYHVAEKQKDGHVQIPRGRQQPMPQPPAIAVDPIPENFELLRSLRNAPSVVPQFIKMWRRIDKTYPSWMKDYLKSTGGPSVAIPNDERKELALLRNRMRTRHNHYNLVNDLAYQQITCERELLRIRQENPDDRSRYERRLDELRPTFDSLKTAHQNLFKDDHSAFLKALDEYRVVTHNVLAWNTRTFEPLLCHSQEDFYPHQPMSLIEITPKTSFVRRINTTERQICFDYINNSFNIGLYTTIQDMLEYLVGSKDSDAYKHFLESLPTLTDPLYGGHHDLVNVRTRSMAMEQVIDIAVAYEAWPYRKSVKDMLGSLSNGFMKET